MESDVISAEPTKSWTVSAFDRVKGEWTTALNHSYDHKPELPLTEVVPANITPARRRPARRSHERILVVSDAQIGYRRVGDELMPLHDESAISAINALAKHIRPDIVVDCGDTTDFAEVGKYEPDSNHFLGTLQPSLQRTHEFYAELSANTPEAERHAVDSNHVKRLGDYVLRHAFPLYGIGRPGDKYPALSYPGLIKIDDAGFVFHGGYHNAEYSPFEDFAFKHGNIAVARGSTAARLAAENPDRNIMQGHAHRMESFYHTDRHGRVFGAFVVGALCRRDGVVPSYHSAIDELNKPLTNYERWQNGVSVVDRYPNGKYTVQHVPIDNGQAIFEGNLYGA